MKAPCGHAFRLLGTVSLRFATRALYSPCLSSSCQCCRRRLSSCWQRLTLLDGWNACMSGSWRAVLPLPSSARGASIGVCYSASSLGDLRDPPVFVDRPIEKRGSGISGSPLNASSRYFRPRYQAFKSLTLKEGHCARRGHMRAWKRLTINRARFALL
jgi:hypothetical protein